MRGTTSSWPKAHDGHNGGGGMKQPKRTGDLTGAACAKLCGRTARVEGPRRDLCQQCWDKERELTDMAIALSTARLKELEELKA